MKCPVGPTVSLDCLYYLLAELDGEIITINFAKGVLLKVG